MVLWTWAKPWSAGLAPWGDMVPGEKGERDRGHRVQTYLSAAFTTDRPIAKSTAARVMTTYLGELLCPAPIKHTFQP